MPGSLEQGRPPLQVELVDVGLREYQPLAYVEVLLHAGEGQRRLPSLVLLPRVRPETQKQLHYLQVPVYACLHQRGQGKGVLAVDVEKIAGVNFGPGKLGPLQQNALGQFQVTVAGCDMQSVATVFVGHGQIYVLLEKEVHHVQLVSLTAQKKCILESIILHIRIGACLVYQVLDEHVISLFLVGHLRDVFFKKLILGSLLSNLLAASTGCIRTGVEECVVAALCSVHLHVDEEAKVVRGVGQVLRTGLLHQDPRRLHVAHHARHHQRCQLCDPQLTLPRRFIFFVTYQFAFV